MSGHGRQVFRSFERAHCNRASEPHGTEGDSTGKPPVLTMLPINAELELNRRGARRLNWLLLGFAVCWETAENPVRKPIDRAG